MRGFAPVAVTGLGRLTVAGERLAAVIARLTVAGERLAAVITRLAVTGERLAKAGRHSVAAA